MHPGGRNHPYGTEKQDRDADKLQFVDAQRTKQYIAASVFVMVVCFVLRVIIRRRMKKG